MGINPIIKIYWELDYVAGSCHALWLWSNSIPFSFTNIQFLLSIVQIEKPKILILIFSNLIRYQDSQLFLSFIIINVL